MRNLSLRLGAHDSLVPVEVVQSMRRLRTLSRGLLFAWLWFMGGTALEAQATASAAPSTVPTLELPVLVVDHLHRPVDDFKLEQLRVRTGAGQPFAPLAMRREGDDPVSLTIMIDASRDSFHDLSQLGDEFASLVGSELLPNDRISLYAFDCGMARSLTGVAPDAAVLRKGVADAMSFPSLHGGPTHSACGKTVHLWDNVAIAVSGLSHAPGRRVLLLISSGADGGSKYDTVAVQQYAFDQGVAIFALRDKRQADADDFTRNSLSTAHGYGNVPTATMTPTPTPRSASGMELLCANDGGLTLISAPEFRKDGIADILFLIRQRFILTIPKGAYQPGTSHSAKVSGTALSPYFFTATGAGEPLTVKTP